MPYLALDIGTHAVRAALISREGETLCSEKRIIDLLRLDDQRVEQDPQQILDAVWAVIHKVMAQVKEAPLSMGVAIQRSTVLAWDKESGQAISPALSWQDTRGEAMLASLQGRAFDIQKRSGLVLSPHYSATKMHYLFSQFKDFDLYHLSRLAVSPLVSFILWHLLEERPYICDESNAGRTQLWHVQDRRWDSVLCQCFGMEIAMLPQVRPVCSYFGRLNGYDVPVRSVAGDQNAALNAVLVSPQDDTVLVNAGSGAFALTYANSSARLAFPLLLGLGHSTEQRTFPIVEGTVNGAGTALSWLAEQAEFQAMGGEAFLFRHLEQWLSKFVDHDVALFLNAVGNIGSPYWRTDLLPKWVPNTSTLEGRAVAVIESIVFLLMANIEKLASLRSKLESCVITGGVARSDGLCQRLASLSCFPVYRLQQLDSTLYGAARLASGFLMPGMNRDSSDVFYPQPEHYSRLSKRYQAFSNLIIGKPLEEHWVAHRGYADQFPENTKEALEAALKCGAQGVEFDVQFSRDNVPVLLHDATVDRTSEESFSVTDLDAKMLIETSVHEPARFGLRHFPTYMNTLQEIADLAVQWPDRLFFLEIKKEVFDRLSRDVVWLIVEPILAPVKSQIVMISYDKAWAEMMKRQDWRSGWILTDYEEASKATLAEIQVEFAICNIKKIQRANIGVWQGDWTWFVYDIQDEPTLNYCRQHGIRWIETWDIQGMMKLA